MWVSIFGNTVIERVCNGNPEFGRIAMSQPQSGFYYTLRLLRSGDGQSIVARHVMHKA